MSFEDISYKPVRVTTLISDGVVSTMPRAWVYPTWDDLKRGRERELAQTDWWAMSDRTITDAQKAYRQFLRDLPANHSDVQDAEDAWADYDISNL
jgi:hypothetical protein